MRHYRYSLETTSPPAAEPLAVAEVKTFLRVDHASDDTLLAQLIGTAREMAETLTGLSLITRSYSMYMDRWEHETLLLPRPPVISLGAVRLYAADNTYQELALSGFQLDNKHPTEARLVLARAMPAPMPGREVNGIEIQYTAGFGATGAEVPPLLKQGMLQLIAHLYENRGDSTERALALSGADVIFKTYRRARIA